MKRRSFFFLPFGVGAFVSSLMGDTYQRYVGPNEPGLKKHIYGDYWIWSWTGWKPGQATMHLHGQWCAVKLDADGELMRDTYCYISLPTGGMGCYRPGDTFDIYAYDKKSVPPIFPNTPEKKKEKVRRQGLKHLLKWIDQYG